MNYKNLEEIKKAMEEKMYVSVTAENKRGIEVEVKQDVFAPIDKTFDTIIALTTKSKFEDLFVGKEINSGGQKSFINELYKDEKSYEISFVFHKDETFYIHKYVLRKLKNGHTRVAYSEYNKLNHTIVGLNGQLGTMKFRKQVKERARNILKFLSNEVLKNN